MLFLRLRLRYEFRNNVAIRWSNVGVIVVDGFSDLKSELLVEVYGFFVVCLHMQVNLANVLLRAEIEDMI